MKKTLTTDYYDLIESMDANLVKAFILLYMSTDNAGIVEVSKSALRKNMKVLEPLKSLLEVSDKYIVFKDYLTLNYGQMKENYNRQAKAFQDATKKGLEIDINTNRVQLKDKYEWK